MGNIDSKNFERTLGEMIARAMNVQKPLTEIGAMMVSVMDQNIERGASDEQWEPSQRAKREGGQTLRDTGTLMHGIKFEVGDGTVSAGPTMLGKNHITDPRAFALLAYGGNKPTPNPSQREGKKKKQRKGFAHYPKRDFTYIPNESFKTFGEIMQQFLTSP